jgi:hypothetical protein
VCIQEKERYLSFSRSCLMGERAQMCWCLVLSGGLKELCYRMGLAFRAPSCPLCELVDEGEVGRAVREFDRK